MTFSLLKPSIYREGDKQGRYEKEVRIKRMLYILPVKNEPQLAAFMPAWVLYGNETADGRTSGPFIHAATGKRLNPFTR